MGLVLMMMTNPRKKNFELMVGVPGRVVRHWNCGQAVKTLSLEMFTAQLNVEPSTTWLKFGVGSDFELWPPFGARSDGIHRV